MTDSPGDSRQRLPRLAAAAGLLLAAVALLLVAGLLCFVVYGQNTREGGATGLGLMFVAVLALGLAWPFLWSAGRLAGGPGWLVRRGRVTTVLVVIGAMVVPTAAVLAGTWKFDAQESVVGEACSDANVALLEAVDPDNALPQAVDFDGSHCGRATWVQGNEYALLTIYDAEAKAEGWSRQGDLKIPATYTKDGKELVVDLARDATGKPVTEGDSGTDGWIYLR